MLQALLADRFKLSVHRDTRPLPAFVLSAGKGQPKMKAAEVTNEPSGCKSPADSGAGTYSRMSCRNVTMATFATALRRYAGDYLPLVVVDSTKLEGAWDFDLEWNSRSRILQAGSERTTIFDAVEKQLGLKLELRNVPAPVLVVDHANPVPTPNPPHTADLLPPRALQFEVATVKLSAPDEKVNYKLLPSGRLELRAFLMRDLIAEAWDIDWNHMDERIAGAPKWIDSRRFDIIAKTAGATDSPRGTGFMDDDLRLMLRALLTERFRMTTHYEERPVSSWTLTAGKPKLRKGDPANRANCRQGGLLADDPRDRNPALSRLIQCQNVTMAQFASQLQSLDPGQFATNGVVDETGLKGSWDLTLSYSPKAMLQGSGVPADGAASEPNGAVSFLDALRQQLGLKLEMRKRPMPVLVIDQLSEQPSEN
jgi:uncharacterized protein (TIGR03435 family)